MKFILADNYSIYPYGMPMCYPGNSWRGQSTAGKSGCVTGTEDGKCSMLLTTEGTAGVYTWFERKASDYVFETDLKLLSDSSAVQIYIDVKNDSSKPAVVGIDAELAGLGRWFDLSLKFKPDADKASIYINREYVKTVPLSLLKHEAHNKTNVIFIKLVAAGNGTESGLAVSETVIYEGDEFCTEDDKAKAFLELSGKVRLGGTFGYKSDMSDERTKRLYASMTEKTDELPLFTNDTELEYVKEKIKLNRYPFSRAWEGVLSDAELALSKEYPMVLLGQASPYMECGIAAAGAVRDLSFCYRITDDEGYAKKAHEILMAWARVKEPVPVYISLGSDVNGLTISRVMVTFAFGYSMLYGYLGEMERLEIEHWFRVMACAIKRSLDFWVANDCYDKQYYQNHIAVMIMGLVALGVAVRDIDILSYALYSDENKYNYEKLLNGTIIGYGDDEIYYKDPCFTGEWKQPQAGEIYDRYRARVGKGIHYSMLSARCLIYVAEILRHYGCNYYSYTGECGENLRMPFEFYSDFYLYRNNTLKGGYYSTSLIHNHECFAFAMAASAYPESEILKRFCLGAPVAQRDTEQFGYIASIIYTPVYPEQKCQNLPRISKITVNGREQDDFSRDRFIYNIGRSVDFRFELAGDVELCAELDGAFDDEYILKIWEKSEPMRFAAYHFKMVDRLLDDIHILSTCCECGEADGESWCVMDMGEDTKVQYFTFCAKCAGDDINVCVETAPFCGDIWTCVSSATDWDGELFRTEIPKANCRYVKLIFSGNGRSKVMHNTIECHNIRGMI